MWRASHRDSFYDERGRETSDLDEYANQATHQEALESCDTVSVRYPTFTVRLGESQQIDVGLITIGERRLIELIGIDAEAEVASRKNENRADDREEPSDDTRADQDRVDGRIGERQALTDGRPSEEGGERARAGENGRGWERRLATTSRCSSSAPRARSYTTSSRLGGTCLRYGEMRTLP